VLVTRGGVLPGKSRLLPEKPVFWVIFCFNFSIFEIFEFVIFYFLVCDLFFSLFFAYFLVFGGFGFGFGTCDGVVVLWFACCAGVSVWLLGPHSGFSRFL